MKTSEEIQRDPSKSLIAESKSPKAIQHLQTLFIPRFINCFNSSYRNSIGMKTNMH